MISGKITALSPDCRVEGEVKCNGDDRRWLKLRQLLAMDFLP